MLGAEPALCTLCTREAGALPLTFDFILGSSWLYTSSVDQGACAYDPSASASQEARITCPDYSLAWMLPQMLDLRISFSTVSTVQNTVSCGTAEKAQWVKGLATKSDDLSWLFSSVSNDI